ncbi:hypothetical protein SAMN05660657_03570 [Geodermatophilus amargosae]|uniref:Uncharacterized protein n=1 Tax=Geodermatophilus amargosae TaxID=1296565 RepID=A0A1I7BH88_9ACTN|nr:hypothetical protein SAMN05660657_03570 [Geodermatophilus amargosae]
MAEARRAYESFRRALADTPGAAPHPSTTALSAGLRPCADDVRPTPTPHVPPEAPGMAHGSG